MSISSSAQSETNDYMMLKDLGEDEISLCFEMVVY